MNYIFMSFVLLLFCKFLFSQDSTTLSTLSSDSSNNTTIYNVTINFPMYYSRCRGLKSVCEITAEEIRCTRRGGCMRAGRAFIVTPQAVFIYYNNSVIPEEEEIYLSCNDTSQIIKIQSLEYESLSDWASYCTEQSSSNCTDLMPLECSSEQCGSERYDDTEICRGVDDSKTSYIQKQCQSNALFSDPSWCTVKVPREKLVNYDKCVNSTQVKCLLSFNYCYAQWAKIVYNCTYRNPDTEREGIRNRKVHSLSMIAVVPMIVILSVVLGAFWTKRFTSKRPNQQ